MKRKRVESNKETKNKILPIRFTDQQIAQIEALNTDQYYLSSFINHIVMQYVKQQIENNTQLIDNQHVI